MNRLLVAAAIGAALFAGAGPGGRQTTVEGREPGDPSFQWPVSRFTLTQGFGCTDVELEPADPECPGGHFHAGLDLAAATGTVVRAAATGLVVFARADESGYGLHVVLDHGRAVTSLYGHLDEIYVHPGELVAEGRAIGGVGSSGNSTGPHLHLEIRRSGGAVDPAGLLPARHAPQGGNS